MLSRDNVVGRATGYELDDRGVGVREFSQLHFVQTGSQAHPASYPMGTGGSFPRSKADSSPPASAEVKKT
jgi:hypothetical protein